MSVISLILKKLKQTAVPLVSTGWRSMQAVGRCDRSCLCCVSWYHCTHETPSHVV